MAPKETSTVPFQVRLTAEEKQAFSDAATARGLNLSTWARITLRRQCSDDLATIGRTSPFPEGKMRRQRTPAELSAAPKPVEVEVLIDSATAFRADNRVAVVLAEDPSRPAVVPAGGKVDAAGRIYDAAGAFVGTAVLATHQHVSRETIPDVIHNLKVDVAGEATFAGARVVRNENLTRLMRGEKTGIDDTHCMAVPRPVDREVDDDFALDEPAAPVSQDPPEE